MHAFSTQSPFECFGVKTLPWPTPSQHGLTRISALSLVINGKDWFFDCATAKEKRDLYGALYRHLQGMKTEDELRPMVRDLAAQHRVDIASFCRDLCMDWQEIIERAVDPQVTFGAHTVNYKMLRKMTYESAVRAEMGMSRAVLEAALRKRPKHLAYPVGNPTSAGPREFHIAAELGFRTAVTTRPDVPFKAHRDHLTALPRISINGEFQRQRCLKVLMSGVATAMRNGCRRVNPA